MKEGGERTMAIVSINYDCGCGFHAKTIEEATRHVDNTLHILNVAGNVRSSEPKVPKAKVSSYASTYPRPRTTDSVPLVTSDEVQIEDAIDFGNLRAKLRKG